MPGVMVPGNSFRNCGTSSGNEEPGAQADVCWSLVGWEVCPKSTAALPANGTFASHRPQAFTTEPFGFTSRRAFAEVVPERVAAGPPNRCAPRRHEQPRRLAAVERLGFTDCASLRRWLRGMLERESRRPPKIARVTRVPECSAFGCG